MAEAKCPRCDGQEFEAKAVTLKGNKMDEARLIICASCGAAIGAVSYSNPLIDHINSYWNSPS